MGDFAAKTHKINEFIKGRQNHSKEFISENESFRAFGYIKFMELNNKADYLLYCASLNLLNSFIKQPGNRKKYGYGFKEYVIRLIENIARSDIDGLSFNFIKKENNFALIQIDDIQFSFHSIHYNETIKRILDNELNDKDMLWDGVRKQGQALSIFKSAIRLKEDRSDRLVFGSPEESLDEFIEQYVHKREEYSPTRKGR